MDKFVNGLKYLWLNSNRFHKAILFFVAIETVPYPGRKYGFHCNDPALSYPFTGDTISWKWLIAVCALLPLAVMLLIERINKLGKENPNRALQWYKEYLFAFIINLCTVHVLKNLVGSPRPHFFDTCKPVEASTCKDSEFVASYTCSKSKWHHQSDQSFPSGHTSMGLLAGIFIAYYLQKRTSRGALARICQVVCVCVSVWCALSRVCDRRHHWWDVLAGAVIGITIVVYTTQHLCKKFDCSVKASDTTTSNGDSNILLTDM